MKKGCHHTCTYLQILLQNLHVSYLDFLRFMESADIYLSFSLFIYIDTKDMFTEYFPGEF